MDLVVDNGKPEEPSATKKVIAALKGDNKMTMVFSHSDIQQMIINKLWRETPWLNTSGYKRAGFKHNLSDNTYTVEWEK